MVELHELFLLLSFPRLLSIYIKPKCETLLANKFPLEEMHVVWYHAARHDDTKAAH